LLFGRLVEPLAPVELFVGLGVLRLVELFVGPVELFVGPVELFVGLGVLRLVELFVGPVELFVGPVELFVGLVFVGPLLELFGQCIQGAT
jgi:hypothetical protein